MGRPLKHTTTRPPGSMRKGNIAARVAKGNIGPTSSTGYYNAYEPTEVGKYVVYKMLGASQAPLSFTPQNDDEFLRLANQEGAGVGEGDVTAALEYFATHNDFTVAAVINSTGSLNVEPFCKYDTLGNNPSTQGKWFNSVAPLDNMNIDNREHALSEIVCMESVNANWGAPYAGTIIYEINGNSVTEKVSATLGPSNGQFSATAGRRYVGNKPISIKGIGNGHAFCPISYYGKEWGYYYSRYQPPKVFFYCLKDNTKVNIYVATSSGSSGRKGMADTTLLTTITGNEGDVVNYTFPDPDPDYRNHYITIKSNEPVVMTARGTSGDKSIGALAGEYNYARSTSYKATTRNTSPSNAGTNVVYDSVLSSWALSIADGSGGDSEVSMPLDMLTKNYTFGHRLNSYYIVSPYANNDIIISSWNGSSWEIFSTHTVNGTQTAPATASSGSQAGGGGNFNSNSLWRFSGDDPFYIVVNDTNSDEEMLLGWNTGEVDTFFM